LNNARETTTMSDRLLSMPTRNTFTAYLVNPSGAIKTNYLMPFYSIK
jgi:hypothetical protein